MARLPSAQLVVKNNKSLITVIIVAVVIIVVSLLLLGATSDLRKIKSKCVHVGNDLKIICFMTGKIIPQDSAPNVYYNPGWLVYALRVCLIRNNSFRSSTFDLSDVRHPKDDTNTKEGES